jgi:hypothetical protein
VRQQSDKQTAKRMPKTDSDCQMFRLRGGADCQYDNLSQVDDVSKKAKTAPIIRKKVAESEIFRKKASFVAIFGTE